MEMVSNLWPFELIPFSLKQDLRQYLLNKGVIEEING